MPDMAGDKIAILSRHYPPLLERYGFTTKTGHLRPFHTLILVFYLDITSSCLGPTLELVWSSCWSSGRVNNPTMIFLDGDFLRWVACLFVVYLFIFICCLFIQLSYFVSLICY